MHALATRIIRTAWQSLLFSALLVSAVYAAGPTRITLDQYNGYFSAKETLAGLKAGEYEFVVTNKAGKKVGFELQDLKTQSRLDIFPLNPGETRSTIVKVGAGGFRYRCPINPTPWYEVSVDE